MLGFGISIAVTLGLALNLWSVRHDRDKLHDDIYNVKTGYVAQLATCHSNVTTLEGGIKTQNDAIEAARLDGQSRIDKAAQAVSEAQERARQSDLKLSRLKQAPSGSTTCEKYEDVDARYLEFLK